LQEKIFEPSEQEKVLLTLEVGSFERDSLRNGFERTLEVVASLAVRLDNLGYAVGFVANGTPKGGNSADIPPSRGPRQVPAILEALARIQATPYTALTKVIQKFLGSQRGISCVHFCCEEDSSLTGMEKFFHKRQIPVSFLVYHHGRNTRSFKGSNRYSMAEICLDRSRKL
jgi:hypothetical protein